MKIAIFSSWLPEVTEENKKLARDIGIYLANNNITIVTGGCSGIPALCIESGFKHGAHTVGYFPHEGQNDYQDRQHEENIHNFNTFLDTTFCAMSN